jgi:hypothetical protein
MHLQYKLRLATGTTSDTPGAAPAEYVESDPVEAAPGRLRKLAQLIADEGINIRLVSGKGIETGGFLLLAVNDEHTHGEAHDHGASPRKSGERPDDQKLRELLDREHYRYEIVAPTYDVLDDHIGALAEWAAKVEREGRLVDTIALGTAEHHTEDHRIPIQATTIAVTAAAGDRGQRRGS